MSNLLKFNRVVIKDNNKVVIDSNSTMQNILDRQAEMERISAIPAREPDEDGFICGLEAATVEEVTTDNIEQEPVITPEELLREANETLDAARSEAEAIREAAREEGYNQGIEDANAYIRDAISEKQAALEQKYIAKQQALEAEYREMREQLEPEIVEVLLDVFSQVTHAIAEDKRDIVFKLIKNVLDNSEVSRNILIRVSTEDYDFVNNNKDKIMSAVTPDTAVEISKDTKLSKNQCIIETDAGVFDCSLDIQLENLISDIRLISHVRR